MSSRDGRSVAVRVERRPTAISETVRVRSAENTYFPQGTVGLLPYRLATFSTTFNAGLPSGGARRLTWVPYVEGGLVRETALAADRRRSAEPPADEDTAERKCDMGELSWWHWLIVIAALMLLFGANKLPQMARSLGQSVRILRSETRAMGDDKGKDRKDDATPSGQQSIQASEATPASALNSHPEPEKQQQA